MGEGGVGRCGSVWGGVGRCGVGLRGVTVVDRSVLGGPVWKTNPVGGEEDDEEEVIGCWREVLREEGRGEDDGAEGVVGGNEKDSCSAKSRHHCCARSNVGSLHICAPLQPESMMKVSFSSVEVASRLARAAVVFELVITSSSPLLLNRFDGRRTVVVNAEKSS
eukprot:scaffold9509_cov206-Ochromonas_danica.AAC.1